MSSLDIRLKFSAEQRAAIDAYRQMLYEKFGMKVSQSQVIRDAVGRQIREAGLDWPDDPQLGGDRRSVQREK